jgi:two-component system sensor histidine kinase UhpB
MYSHLSREQNKQNKSGEVENSLKIIQQNAGDMVSKLGEIVWLTNPGQDSLMQLAQRLEEYLYDMAMVKNFKVKSGLVDNIASINLPAEIRRNIYLLFKEAINNAVKYSNATLIELHVKDENEEVKITLQDNGNGFDKDAIKRGNGLTNMEQRAKEAGIKLFY